MPVLIRSMFKFPLLIIYWLIAFGSSGQAPSAAFPDTPTITENSVGKAKTEMTVSQLKRAYNGCVFEQRSTTSYGQGGDTKQTTGICIKCRGHELFFARIYEGEVRTLIVLNSRYKTAKGLHVGSTATELKTALPTAKVIKTIDKKVQLAETMNEEGESISYYFKDQSEDIGNYELIPKPSKGLPKGTFYEGVPIQAASAKIRWIRVDDPSKIL